MRRCREVNRDGGEEGHSEEAGCKHRQDRQEGAGDARVQAFGDEIGDQGSHAFGDQGSHAFGDQIGHAFGDLKRAARFDFGRVRHHAGPVLVRGDRGRR
jgi:hypothetical protein